MGTLVIFVVDRKHRKTFVFLVIYGMVGTLWRDIRGGMPGCGGDRGLSAACQRLVGGLSVLTDPPGN